MKNASRIQPTDLASLRSFGDEYPEARLILLHRGKEQYLTDKILCVPCERFLRHLKPNQALPDTAWRC